MMSVEDVRGAVEGVRSMAGDGEAAHTAEDALHQAVLRAIADGADDPEALAFAALQTRNIAFARLCA